MKKNLLFIAFTAIITCLISSCQSTNEPTTYPNNLIGFWASTSNAEQQWYGLEVLDANHANFITYEGTESLHIDAFELVYTSTNGKGTLTGDGVTRKIQAINDTTISIQMVGGDMTFTKTTKPAEAFSLTGYWKQETTSGYATHLLFYPKNKQDENIVTIIREEDGILEGSMAHIVSFDNETYTGIITYIGETNKMFAITATDFNHLTFTFGKDINLTKQPRFINAPKTLQGTWITSIPGLLELSIIVDENEQCQINYILQGVSGEAKGKLHYCERAGMGVFVPTEYDTENEYAYLFEGFECGIFTIQSHNQISISIEQIGISISELGLSNELILTKK
ncbi:MAG: hypothetical protein IKY87_01480 [Paludibacteraceae bacterium]|nr:hypothetical protein [Paludibacteraceae bacterium]